MKNKLESQFVLVLLVAVLTALSILAALQQLGYFGDMVLELVR